RFRLLIDLQFEEARVLAPELDVAERIEAGTSGGVESFELDVEALDRVFDELGAGSAAVAEAAEGTGDGEDAEPATAARLLEAASAALARGKCDLAIRYAQRASVSDEDRIAALLVLGEAFLARELAGEALERFRTVLDELESVGGDIDARADALAGSVRSFLMLGRVKEALDAARRLRALRPDDGPTLRLLGEALVRAKHVERAIAVLERALAVGPEDAEVWTALG